MRRRARVAPPINKADDEESHQDEFLPSDQLARRRGRDKGRCGRTAGCCRQRELQKDEPVDQDFDEATFALEV